jgi:5'-nucleotidase
VVLRRDPQGAAYFWLSGRRVLSRLEPGTDVAAVAEGFVSLTPLHSNHAHRGSFSRLRSWDIPS